MPLTQQKIKKSSNMSTTSTEVWVVPFFGQGHLFPSMELCKHLASIDIKVTLVISSNLSSSIPSSLRQFPLIEIAELPSQPFPPPPPQPGSNPPPGPGPFHMQNNAMAKFLENLLSDRPDSKPACAIVDVMMSWSGETFKSSGVPVIGFFTSGAASAALEYATWKADIDNFKPGEIRLLPGLPDDMALTDTDLKEPHHGPPKGGGKGGPIGLSGPPPWLRDEVALTDADLKEPHHGPPTGGGKGGPICLPGPPPFFADKKRGGPPKLGGPPPWLEETDGFIGLMVNTCHELEGQFLDYIGSQVGKPVWGVGPLLPQQFWNSTSSLIHDHDIRSDKPSNVTEDQVIEWLDRKPPGSVLYISFGSEVGPNMEELEQLGYALEESNRPFIWVLQPGSGRSGPHGPPGPGTSANEEEGFFPHGLEDRVGERGLIISGWAPQLLILSHKSTGGFLSHCGWNSTVEALGCGVGILAWPIRGDQFRNAKLVAKHFKVGYMICNDMSKAVKRDDIMKGIEELMKDDEDMRSRSAALKAMFKNGFPSSSDASICAFKDFITHIIT